MDPDDEAFEAAARRPARPAPHAVRADRRRGCASSACRSTPQVARARPVDDDALGRPTIARALVARRPRRRASRTRSGGSSGTAARPTCRARAWARGRRSTRSALPAARRSSRTSARRRPAPTSCASSVDAGLRGLEVYYRSFDAATVDARRATVADALGLLATGGTRLPRRPRPTPRRTPTCGSRARSARADRPSGAQALTGVRCRRAMTDRSPPRRALPDARDLAPPPRRRAAAPEPRPPTSASTEYLPRGPRRCRGSTSGRSAAR